MNRENITDLTIQDDTQTLEKNEQPQNDQSETVDGYMVDNRYNAKYPILICQIVAAVIVLVLVFAIKYCFGAYYSITKNWYLSTIAQSRAEPKSDQPQPTKNDTSSNIATNDGEPSDTQSDASYVETGAMMLEVLNKKTTVADFGFPLKNYVITSGFGGREDPISGQDAVHSGIDLAADSGSEIYAALDGKVETADCTNYYGNYLVLSHGSVYTTLYGHCQKLLVNKGEQVKKGQKIALVGSTGRSTGPHLHFEISVGGRRVDPLKYIDL